MLKRHTRSHTPTSDRTVRAARENMSDRISEVTREAR